ncbi:MAG: methionyl-tRNA formyltransferase [Acidobacteria bacterium]|nr:methionyl-tRNA formyltransferase [Acidobacteriota bacterium]MBE56010.1 methionyl-tRNA formyltransferase [Acidobacteriota bacterium]
MVRIAFFGTPEFAVPTLSALIESPCEVVTVITQPDRPRGRGQRPSASPIKILALRKHIPVLAPEALNDSVFLNQMRALQLELGVVVAYGKLVPDNLLEIPTCGFVNLHASLLPAYRGAAPIQRAVLDGNQVTGVTLIRMDSKLDSGPILAQAQQSIRPTDTASDLASALAHLGASLLRDNLSNIMSGNLVEAPQDNTVVTYAPRLTKNDGRIDWNSDAPTIHNQVRAMHPWPQAFTYLGGIRYAIYRTAVIAHPSKGRPGEILETGGSRLVVAAGGKTTLEILEIQPSGRRVMEIQSFLAGHPVTPGSVFESPTKT